MAFRKGQSGNPGGRPVGFGRAIRAEFGDDGKMLLLELKKFALGKVKCSSRDRLFALKELLDRGYGKAPQAVEVTGADGGPVTVKFVDA